MSESKCGRCTDGLPCPVHTACSNPYPDPEPIPMRLHCPSCGELHVDTGEWAKKPHHTHACQSCGMVWRPAVVDTVGVQFLPGFLNLDGTPMSEPARNSRQVSEPYPTVACAHCGERFEQWGPDWICCDRCTRSGVSGG